MQTLLASKGIKSVLDVVGSQGPYQLRVSLIIALQYLFRSFFLIYYAYLTQPPIFQCTDGQGSYYDCFENNGGCIDKNLSINSPNSLVIDLGFYCENSYVRTLGSSFFFIGGNIGCAYFSYISDKLGRKAAMARSYLLGSIALFLLGTATIGPVTYVFFLMAIWGSLGCFTVLSLTYVSEVSNEKFARKASILLLLSITIGQLIIITLAYFIPYWQLVFVGCIGVPALLTNLSFKFLDETPVYLYSKKENNKVLQVLDKIAKVNKTELCIDYQKDCETATVSTQQVQQLPIKPAKSWNYIKIILHPKLRTRVLTFGLIRFYLTMAYFGCIFALSSLGGDIYTNSIIAASAEGLGYTLSLKANLFPPRKLLKGSLVVVVATGISFLFIPALSCDGLFICRPLFLQGLLSLIMRTAVCFIYGFLYVLGNELFPAEVRGQSNGIGGIFADLGGMTAPVILMFSQNNQLNPLFVFGIIGFMALGSSQYLPHEPLVSLDDENDDVEMNYVKMVD